MHVIALFLLSIDLVTRESMDSKGTDIQWIFLGWSLQDLEHIQMTSTAVLLAQPPTNENSIFGGSCSFSVIKNLQEQSNSEDLYQ